MSNKINDGGPAFPAWELNGQGQQEMTCFGMTLRDYFAAKAMCGMLADLPKSLYGLDWAEKLASSSYEVADAMMKARAQ